MTVYCIRSECGAVKIGVAKDVQRRLDNLQIGSPMALEVIGVLPGDEADERDLHERFAHRRSRGEWFDDAGGEISGVFAPYLRSGRVISALHDHPLSEYLAARQIRQSAFAKVIGVSKGYLTELLNGTKTPGLQAAVNIEAATGGVILASSWLKPTITRPVEEDAA